MATERSDQYDPAELAAFEQAVRESTYRRIGERPTHPKVVLQKLLAAKGLSVVDVFHKTGLRPEIVRNLLNGTQTFNDLILDKLTPVVGRSVNVLRGLQEMTNFFQSNLRRRPVPPRTPDPETVRYFSSLER
jgi:hypothetical protein